MDIVFSNNLDDGINLFNLVKKFDNLEGVYIISSNLRELPSNAFITANSQFGNQLQIVRICNSLISKLYDLTFAHLTNLQWIDLGDNRIDQITANTFTMVNANGEVALRISLSGNRLTTQSIEEGAFSDVKRSVDIYLNDNKIDTLKESVWYRLINSEKNILVHLKNNRLVCDCRHHWIGVHKAETELHFKDANCESGQSVLSKNFALCEKAPLLDPFGDVYKKCCRQIQYKNKPPVDETVLITETDHHSNRVDRLIEKTSVSKTHQDDYRQIKEEVQIKQQFADIKQHVDIPVVKHVDLPVVKHIDTVKHIDSGVKQAPILSRVEHVETSIKQAPIVTRVEHLETAVKHTPIVTRVEHLETGVKHAPVVTRVEHLETGVKHAPIVTRVEHLETGIKQAPVVTRVEHLETGVKHAPVVSRVERVETTKHVDAEHLHETSHHVEHHHEPEIRTELVTNQRLVALPPKLHRLLSPAVLVKKPLKYRRLVASASSSNQVRHPVHHMMYAESSVPHTSIVRANGDSI